MEITAETRPKTTQEVFDYVVSFLRRQGRKAQDDDESDGCQYLTFDGLKCAAGCLIPRVEYSKKFEGQTLRPNDPEGNPISRYFASRFDKQCLLIIGQLQQIHDCENVSSWEAKWERLANEHNLTMPKT